MAEFKVQISEMNDAASTFVKESENFRSTSDLMLKAAAELTQAGGGFDDKAGQNFHEAITKMDAWVKQMSELIDEYSQKLNTSAEIYQDTDQAAAKKFQR